MDYRHQRVLSFVACIGVLVAFPAKLPAQATGALSGKAHTILGNEPIVIDPDRAYPTVQTPPGSPFHAASYASNAVIAQLAHSSDGIVRLPPGDYSIPILLYCTSIHVADTQHGLSYRLLPLEGKRASLLIALMSRAPAAHVPFQALQPLIWQIEGGLSYAQLPRQSQQLVDQLVPELKGQLNEDFVRALEKKLNATEFLIRQLPLSGPARASAQQAAAQIAAMIQRYSITRDMLLRYADNYNALAHQMVHIIPGTAPNAGPTTWSQINTRVYAHITGGSVWQEMAKLEVRVLPSAELIRGGGTREIEVYFPTAVATSTSDPANDSADVPVGAMLAFPGPANQALVGVVAGSSSLSPALILKLEILSGELMGIENVLLWIDCALPTSVADVTAVGGDVVVEAVQPGLEPQFSDAAGSTALLIDIGKAIGDLVTKGDPIALFTTVAPQALLQAYGFSCSNYNLGKAIVSNLQRVSTSMVAGSDSLTYVGILPGSISIGQGAVTAQATLKAGVQNSTVKFRLHLLPCANRTDCLSKVGTPPQPASVSTPMQTGQAQSTVTGSTARSQNPVADETIIQNINNKLLADSVLKSREILVTSRKGTVTLAGTVNNVTEKATVEQIARSQQGVSQVIDRIVVAPSPPATSTPPVVAQGSTGCNGRPASGHLTLWITGTDLSTGLVNVNGVDNRQPTRAAFAWTWGDGTTTQGWFPQSHVYADTRQNYMLQVTSHEDDGSTDCAEIAVRWTGDVSSASRAGGRPATNSGLPETPSNPPQSPGTATHPSKSTGIHSVDFLNFDYSSDCWEQFDGFQKVIHVSKGQWCKEGVGCFGIGKPASEWMVSYGDLKGDGQEEIVVVTSCQGPVNFDYEEIFVFAMSFAGPQLLARLSPSEWGPGTRIYDVSVDKQRLVVRYLGGGSHACPDTRVTARFHWNGSRFVRVGQPGREPFNCDTR